MERKLLFLIQTLDTEGLGLVLRNYSLLVESNGTVWSIKIISTSCDFYLKKCDENIPGNNLLFFQLLSRFFASRRTDVLITTHFA